MNKVIYFLVSALLVFEVLLLVITIHFGLSVKKGPGYNEALGLFIGLFILIFIIIISLIFILIKKKKGGDENR